jgi:2-polyprenyl-3-methyl-5-hydroxy-6-metoxy-1,4-benzoquinol methylase
MTDNTLLCGCCGSLMQAIGWHESYKHYMCEVCQHERFVSHENSIESQLYEEDSDYISDLSVAANHKALLMWNHAMAIPHLYELGNHKALDVLDIGCFNGFFVKELRDRGFNAIGLDFNRKALEFGRRVYGLGDFILDKSLHDLIIDKQRFDAITIFEVIEHLENYTELIEQATSLLRPGGVLIISTPNQKMSWRPQLDFPPHHLSRFSPESLKRLMNYHGFELVCSKEQSSVFDLLRNFIGSKFRKDSNTSMRGGDFRSPKIVRILQTIANRLKWIFYKILSPVDFLFFIFGGRYISQIIVSRKKH